MDSNNRSEEGGSQVGDFNSENVKSVLTRIFHNFAKFGEEDQEFFMPHSAVIKVLRTANILQSSSLAAYFLKQNDVDLVLRKISPGSNRINLNQFMNLVAVLASKIDSEGFSANAKQTVVKLVKFYFEGFSNLISDDAEAETKHRERNLEVNKAEGDHPDEEEIPGRENASVFGNLSHKHIENRINSFKIDEDVCLILDSVHNGLKHIFSMYFYFEVNKINDRDKLLKNSLEGLLKFCKHFEISPFLLTADKVAIFFNLLIATNTQNIFSLQTGKSNKDGVMQSNHTKDSNQTSQSQLFRGKNLGEIFTISKFAIFLVHMAILSFEKYSSYEESNTLKNNTNLTNCENYDKHSHSKNHFCDLVKTTKLQMAEKVVFFLEKLESSKGHETLQRESNKTYNSTKSLIPSLEVVTRINPQLLKLFLRDEDKSTSRSKATYKTKLNSTTTGNSSAQGKNIKMSSRIPDNYESLSEIFETYAQIGDKYQNCHMSLSGFKRFLQDCSLVHGTNEPPTNNIKNSPMRFSTARSRLSHHNLLSQLNLLNINKSTSKIQIGKITEQDINIIFSNLTGMRNFVNHDKIKKNFDRNKGFSLDFDQCGMTANLEKPDDKVSNKVNIPFRLNLDLFLRSLELVAGKMNPDWDTELAIKHLFDSCLDKLIKQHSESNLCNVKKTLIDALTFMKNDEITELMKILNSVIYPHYLNYASEHGLISFDNFLQFYSDFTIFPDVVNLIQLKNIFFTLADFLKTQIGGDRSQDGVERLAKSGSYNDLKSFKSFMTSESTVNSKVRMFLQNTSCLNYELFSDSLTLAALHSKVYEDNTEIEKLVHLAEKMSKSKGVEKSQLRSGQTFNSNMEFHAAIASIKLRLPELYKKKKDYKQILRSPSLFQEIFDQEILEVEEENVESPSKMQK